MLLKHDAPVKVKNGLGWTVLAEAVSYGNRPTSIKWNMIIYHHIYKCVLFFQYLHWSENLGNNQENKWKKDDQTWLKR